MLTFERLLDILKTRKQLAIQPHWVSSNKNLMLSAPISIDGAVVEGLELRGTALANIPLREVTLGLVLRPAAVRGGMFDRIDAWPIRSHQNPPSAKGALRLLRLQCGQSQHHALADNAHLAIADLLDRLPIARPIDPPPESWRDLLRYAEAAWGFQELLLPSPPWAPDLFSMLGENPEGGGVRR